MIKIKPKTWYYLYKDHNNDIFLDDEPPYRDGVEGCWKHPLLNTYKTLGNPVIFDNTEGPKPIQEFKIQPSDAVDLP